MNEYELRRALDGHAAEMISIPDPDRLVAGFARADRLRTARAAGAAGLLSVFAVLGIFAAQAGETATSLDVSGNPNNVAPPQVDFPLLDDPSAESATTTTGPPAAPSTSAPKIQLTPNEPAYLSNTPTTSAAPVAVLATTTTVPPTTTLPATATTAPGTTVPPTNAPPTTTVAPDFDFTANAKYGSCELDPPYDKYSGTGEVGATITITSPYSTTETMTVGADGYWSKKVFFDAAPFDELFDVTISDGTDTKTLSFVRTTPAA